jgi:hypothetical protein
VEEAKRRTARFKKSSSFDSVVEWNIAEKVERSGEWMIYSLDDDGFRGEKTKKGLRRRD